MNKVQLYNGTVYAILHPTQFRDSDPSTCVLHEHLCGIEPQYCREGDRLCYHCDCSDLQIFICRLFRCNQRRPNARPNPALPLNRRQELNNPTSSTSRPSSGSNPIILNNTQTGSVRVPSRTLNRTVTERSDQETSTDPEFAPRPHNNSTFLPSSEDVCPICIENVSPSQASSLSCAHVFHETCVSSWFARSSDPACPVCRSGIG